MVTWIAAGGEIMAMIRAKGETKYGKMDITITGEEMVESVTSPDPGTDDFIRDMIRNGDGWIANGYYPDPDTMLQAYALCLNLFDEKDIKVDGEIPEMECEEGVIY